MRVISTLFTFSLILFSTVHIKAQTREISGTVLAFNTYPLKGVTVKSKKNKKDVLADQDGRFKISVKKNDVLIFDARTFERFTYRIKVDDITVKINLIYENKQKNKDIAVDHGLIIREDLDYGLENLIEENSAFNNFSSIFDAIRYALPTVTLFDEGGKTKIMMRGPSTLTKSNAALTLVDGIIVEDIGYLNPADVATIELMSSSKAAIYGSRAFNGVVLITMKK